MSTAEEQVATDIQAAAPVVEAGAAVVGAATGNPEAETLAVAGITLAEGLAQLVVALQAKNAAPVTTAEWHNMGTAFGAALAAYNKAP